MHISDIANECALECLKLSQTARDRGLAQQLARIAQRLQDAVHRECDIVFADEDVFNDEPLPPGKRTQIG